MNGTVGRAGRGLLLWLVVTTTTAGVALWLAPDARAGLVAARGTGSFTTLLTGVCAVALTACLVWAWLVTTVVLVGASRGATSVRGVPAWARRAVLGACGLALVGAAAPAMAGVDTPAFHETHVSAAHPSLAGLPLPDRALGGGPRPAGRPARREIVVRPGDSLWDLAAARLGPRADTTAVAAATAALYRANRAVIGDDPDLIRPGQHLRVPPNEGLTDR